MKIISPDSYNAELGNNFKILKAVKDFPEPDSPTKATVLPAGIFIEILSTTFLLFLNEID